MLSKEKIIERLQTIKYPGYNRDIVSFGIIKELSLQDSTIKIVLNLTSQKAEVREQITTLVREQLASMPDVKKVELDVVVPTGQSPYAPASQPLQPLLPEVRYKIAVASGKGGVGKSTVAVNLALALAKQGARVGLLDADIYGPNIPMMLGTSEKPKTKGDKALPLEKYGIKIMSIGFFLPEDTPIIWRGPLVGKAIEQLLRDVTWEDIDYLVVDMPPGTGDAQLSLSQLVSLSGAVIVTTPQDIALSDAIKGVLMFQKVGVKILGIVENMSRFICLHCGKSTEIFGHGGAKKVSEKLQVEFLGEIPLDTAIRLSGDQGEPIVVAQPDSPQTHAFFAIMEQILNQLPLPKKEHEV